MITWDILFGGLLLIWICIRTFSYGKWTWSKNNRLGATVIFFIAFIEIGLPFYIVFIRQ